MVAHLDDDEQVHHVGLETRLVRQSSKRMGNHMRRVDIVQRPLRRDVRFGKDKLGERGNLFGLELGGEALHLRRRTTVGDNLCRFTFLQTAEIVRQQCRTHRTEPRRTVTFGAVLLIELRHIGRCNGA